MILIWNDIKMAQTKKQETKSLIFDHRLLEKIENQNKKNIYETIPQRNEYDETQFKTKWIRNRIFDFFINPANKRNKFYSWYTGNILKPNIEFYDYYNRDDKYNDDIILSYYNDPDFSEIWKRYQYIKNYRPDNRKLSLCLKSVYDNNNYSTLSYIKSTSDPLGIKNNMIMIKAICIAIIQNPNIETLHIIGKIDAISEFIKFAHELLRYNSTLTKMILTFVNFDIRKNREYNLDLRLLDVQLKKSKEKRTIKRNNVITLLRLIFTKAQPYLANEIVENILQPKFNLWILDDQNKFFCLSLDES